MEVHWGECWTAFLFVISVSLLRDVESAAPYVKPVAVFNINKHQARSGTASVSAPEGTYRRVGYNPYGSKASVNDNKESTSQTAGVTLSQVEQFPGGRKVTDSNTRSSAYTRNSYPSRQTGASKRPGYVPSVSGNTGYPAKKRPGYPAEPRSVYPAESRSGYPAKPRSTYTAETRPGYPAKPRTTYPAESRSGYPAKPRSTYPAESRSGYPAKPRSGYTAETRSSASRRGYPRTKSAYPQRPAGYSRSTYQAKQPRGYPRRPSATVTQPRPRNYKTPEVPRYPERRYSQTAATDLQASYKPRSLSTRYSPPASSGRQVPLKSRSFPARRYSPTANTDRQVPYKSGAPPARYPQSISPSRGYPRSPTPIRSYSRNRPPSGYPASKREGQTYQRPVQTRTYQEGYRSNQASPTPRRPPSRGVPRTQSIRRAYSPTQSRGRSYPQAQEPARRYPETSSRTAGRSRTSVQRISASRNYPYSQPQTTKYKPPVQSVSQTRGYSRTQPSTRYRTPGRHYVSGQKYGSYPRRNANAVHSLAARPQSSSYSRSYPQRQNSARYDLNTKNINQKQFWQYAPKQHQDPAPKPNYYRPPVRQPPPRSYQQGRYPPPTQVYQQGRRYQPQPQRHDPYPRGYPRSYYGGEQRFPQRLAAPPIPQAPTTPMTTTTAATTTTVAATTTVPAEYEAPEVEMMTGATGPSSTTTLHPPAAAPTGTPPPGVPSHIHNPKSGYAMGYDQFGNYQSGPPLGGYDPNRNPPFGGYPQYGTYAPQRSNYYGWDTGARAAYQPRYPPRAPPTPAPAPIVTTTLVPVLPIESEAAEGEPLAQTVPPSTAAVTTPPMPAVPVPPPYRPIEFKPYRYLNKYGVWQTWYPHYRMVQKYRVRRQTLVRS